MGVIFNNAMRNNVLNVPNLNKNIYVNRNINENDFSIKNNKSLKSRDSISISPLGKAKIFIESLLEQKQKIVESKNELIARTLEKGEGMDSIKLQLESFEEQLTNIEGQLVQITAEQLKQQTEEQKKITYEKPKTEEEIQNERLNSVAGLFSSLNQAKVVASVKDKVDGESRILKVEIKIDEERGGVASYKREKLADLGKASADLTSKINERLLDITEDFKENNIPKKVLQENKKVEDEWEVSLADDKDLGTEHGDSYE